VIQGAIDVIIPVRNGAETISAAIQSAAAQTLPPRKIIVVDDGSADRTAEVVTGLKSPMVALITTAPRGVSHARNAGFAASQAEFVALLDADDLWRPDKLAKQAEKAANSPHAVAVACSTVEVETDGRVAKRTFKRIPPGPQLPSPILQNRAFFGGWCSSVLVRGQAWRDVGGFDERIAYGEDADFALRLARAGAIESCDDVLAYLVRNPNSVTRRPVRRDAIMDDVLAKFVICEKWIRLDPECRPSAAAYGAWAILSALVRHPWLVAKLPECRARMVQETPELAAMIARSNAELALNLIVYGSKLGHRLPFALARILRRATARLKLGAKPQSSRPLAVRDVLEHVGHPVD
jgi:glycosyltransferase involved in cell wall biosynthesis